MGGRRGFTLVELLITIAIIGILASIMLVAAFSAQETSKDRKTRVLITKLDSVVRQRWEGYRTRRVPAFMEAEQFTDMNNNGIWDTGEALNPDVIPNGVWDKAPTTSREKAQRRLDSLRDLMRLEMPERISDIATIDPSTFAVSFNGPVTGIPVPAVANTYFRKIQSANAQKVNLLQFQTAECLHMIVMAAVAEEGDSRDVFRASDVRDTDGDGLPEFIDGWGTPIMFLRWPVGFISDLNTSVAGQVVNSPTNMSNKAEIEVSAIGLSTVTDFYVNSALLFTSGSLAGQTAKITAYTPGSPGKFTCVTPMSTQAPFTGSTPVVNDNCIVLAPDPFDHSAVYPEFANQETRQATFAVFPLVMSAGPDKVFDVVTKLTSGGSTFVYSQHRNNPFWSCDPANASGIVIGAQKDVDDPMGTDSWKDNIHNHALSGR